MANLQLTFDDGPQPVATALDPILSELARRGRKAAFFLLGQEVQADPQATRTISSKGHALGNHSWDHLEPHTSGYTDAQIKDQFKRTHDAVQTGAGTAMRHWRAPRLEQIPRLTGLLAGAGLLYTLSHNDIHADSKDSQGANDDAAMLKAIRADMAASPARTVFRVLFHVKPTTAVALRAVLDGLEHDHHQLVDFAQNT